MDNETEELIVKIKKAVEDYNYWEEDSFRKFIETVDEAVCALLEKYNIPDEKWKS